MEKLSHINYETREITVFLPEYEVPKEAIMKEFEKCVDDYLAKKPSSYLTKVEA